MKRHIISQPAIKDLEEILDYFSSRDVEAGERFINKFEKKCKNLADFPNMGRSYDDIKPSLQGLPLAGYIIFYRIIDDGIEIIRVISGYRDLKSLFLEDE
jgi:toxin ParE1/3/4